MQETNPLVLEILKLDKGLKMSLYEQKELFSTLRHYSQCQISPVEIDRLCQEIVYVLNKAGGKSAHDADLAGGLKKTGQLLWDHLFTTHVKLKLQATHNPDLILAIDEELINIPWELLYDGRNFLCLAFNLGRVVRTKEQGSSIQYRSAQSTLKMMILANPTNDLKSAYQEGIAIRNQFDKKRSSVRIDFKSTSIDRMYVKRNMRDYDIVHFAGHCEYGHDNPRASGWVLADGRFGVHDILALGSAEPLPSLVFSNACYSAKVAPYAIDTDYQEKNYSLAAAFLFSGVRHYIGAIRRIEDPVSLLFSKEFYAELIAGKSVGESIRLSRVKLIKEYGISNIAWASYLLYGDPNFTLFRALPGKTTQKAKKPLLYTRKRFIVSGLVTAVVAGCIFLTVWLPTLNPNSYFLFLRSQKLFNEGSNEQAVSQSLSLIKKDPEFLQIYPILAYTYQRLGEKENALKYYFDYARLSEKKNDRRNLAAAYLEIGWFYHMEGEYPKAYDFYNKALNLSQAFKDTLHEAVALRKLAVWYIDKKDPDRSLGLLTKSAEINRAHQGSREYRYNLACDYFDIGLVFADKDDFAAAKEFYLKSKAIFEQLQLKNELSDYYFNLGEICLFEKQYQKALEYYFAGLKIDEAQKNRASLPSDYNMVGELYAEMDSPQEAVEYFNRGLEASQRVHSRPDEASSFLNLGLVYKKMGKTNKAREYLRSAQEIYSVIDRSSYEEVKSQLLSLDSS